MRKPLILFVAVLVAVSTVGCTSTPDAPASTPTGDGTTVLPVGKNDMTLTAGQYRSPDGFRPPLVMRVPAGWTSIHRGADGFDFGKPDPTRDAPLFAVVVLAPSEPTAAAALAAVRARTNATLTPVAGTLGRLPAEGLDVADGTGPLVSSSAHGIGLDAAPGQRVRLLAVDISGAPVVCVVLVPDGQQWDTIWPQVTPFLDSLTAA